MLKSFQITAASIEEVMDRQVKVAEELRKYEQNSPEYKTLLEEYKRLEARISLRLQAKESRGTFDERVEIAERKEK